MSRLPTTDLYFMNSCGHQVGNRFKRGAIRQLGYNCFATGKATLLIRRDRDQLMRSLRNHPGQFIYLIDDDIAGAVDSPSLPSDYRDRLLRFHEEHHQGLTERADILVVTSPALMERFSWHPDVRLLHPLWHIPMADDAHFDEIERSGLIRAVHLGSSSHIDSIDFLRPILEVLLERHERLHFTYVSAKPIMGKLDQHPRIRRLPPLSWRRYRKWIAGQRFHIGLYPLNSSPFSQARSRNKLLEYGVVGAAAVYPNRWMDAPMSKLQAIFAGEKENEWVEAISEALASPNMLRDLAIKARPMLDQLNAPTTQKCFWNELLGIDF